MGPDLLVLLTDTARADAFSPWGDRVRTPEMDALARDGIAYDAATSPAPWTLPSTASMFSGRLPTEHAISGDSFRWTEGRPTSPADAVKAWKGPWLPEDLRDRGYSTWAASCNIWISPWGGFDRGFDTFLHLHDRTRLPISGRAGRAVVKARRMYGRMDRGGRQALDAFRRRAAQRDPNPLLAVVNLMEVHAPYDPPRPFYPYPFWHRARTRRLSGGSNKARRFLSYNTRVAAPPADYVRTIRRLYYSAARYEDWLIGRFVDAVRRRDRPAVVVVVSDHGENLGEHGLFNHNSSLAQTLLHVPLVLYGHGVDVGSARLDHPVSLLGLAPWLLRLADGERPDPPDGDGIVVSEYESTIRHNGIPADIQGMIDSGDPARVPQLVHRPGVALRSGNLKYVAVEEGRDEVFDLASDPGEEHDLLPAKPELAERFAAAREEWTKRRARLPVEEQGDPGEVAEGEIADHLRSLGYID